MLRSLLRHAQAQSWCALTGLDFLAVIAALVCTPDHELAQQQRRATVPVGRQRS